MEDPAETANVWANHPARVSIMMEAMEERHRENAELRKALGEVTASRDAMAKRHPPTAGPTAAAPAPEQPSGQPG